MDSKDRKQLDLLNGGDEPHAEEVTPQLIRQIRNKPTFLSAWNYAQSISCLEDKEVYGALQIDASHWTKITKGLASPPGDARFDQYLDVIKNEIPLIWWCEHRGYDFLSMRRHRSAVERENEALKEDLAQHKRTIQLLVNARGGA